MRDNKATREIAWKTMWRAFEPYHGRIIAEWTNDNHDSIYVWLVCSRKADAGEDRHLWRGTVAVRIMPDGGSFVFVSEDLVAKGLKLTIPSSWTLTQGVLDALIPDLPPQKAED